MERVINPLHGFKKVYKKMVNVITPYNYDNALKPVLWLDASDINSYPGTGNTWYDLSGEGNHATKVGTGVAFDATDNTFTFSAATSYFNLGNAVAATSKLYPKDGSMTFSFYAKMSGNNYQSLWIGNTNYAGTNKGIGIHCVTSNRVGLAVRHDDDTLSSVLTNTMYYNTINNIFGWITVVFNTTDNTIKWYLNGVYNGYTDITSNSPVNGVDTLPIYLFGQYYRFYGKAQKVKIYNKALTDTQIAALFSA